MCISLPDSDRRSRFMDGPGAAWFRFYDAFNGSTSDPSQHFNDARFADRYDAAPTPGQAGCAISHFRVLEAFASSTGPEDGVALISEDDVLMPAGTGAVIDDILKDDTFDVAVLADRGPTNPSLAFQRLLMTEAQLSLLSRPLVRGGRIRRLGRFAGNPYTTAFYLITRSGAQKLVSGLVEDAGGPWTIADDWPLFRDRYGLDIRVLRPGLVTYMGGSTTRDAESLARDSETPDRAGSFLARVKTAVALRSRWQAARLAVRATLHDIAAR
ncbi:glycosyltransferase family 25 protein [Micrococcus sp. HOU01]|uniref:glycosyltransferase family 25 protein n=1 Tax=Micrococcus sp. HOU01 TaxID=3101753 RepID=UPI002D786803|nr:glycosyltransferase family 25 protein [Micrococcus sp. HOU1]WRQ43304.1 glycosyltransferase family 25 protein [Micrococcus sp. HOU1]